MELGSLYNNPSVKFPKTTEELVDSTIHIGLELEVTGVNGNEIPRNLQTRYRCSPDNSLRGNGHGGPMEFTFNRPMAGQDIITALDVLDSAFKRSQARHWELSNRGSTHVHLDARDLEIDQIGWLVLMSASLEDYLFTLNGSEYRQGSVFCRSLKALPEALMQAMRNIKAKGTINGARDLSNFVRRTSTSSAGLAMMFGEGVGTEGECLKYSAINLSAMSLFQSIEYRHFRPCCEKQELLDIINPLLLLKQSAVATNPVETFESNFADVAPDAVINLKKYVRLVEEI